MAIFGTRPVRHGHVPPLPAPPPPEGYVERPRIATSRKTGVELLKALGIPTEHCARATIILEPNDIIRVQAEYNAREPVDGEFARILKEYRLVESADDPPVS